VHLFEVFDRGQYIYAGEVELAGQPYAEEQPDVEGDPRQVWMFPLKLREGGLRPTPTTGLVHKLQALKEKSLAHLSTATLKRRAKKAASTPAKRLTCAEQFIRNPYVAMYVKKATRGYCDLCQGEAPFRKDGEPFLHCHHVLWLARGRPDIVQNAVALCPNCHERMHQSRRQETGSPDGGTGPGTPAIRRIQNERPPKRGSIVPSDGMTFVHK
jgi:5-methylcytosine-specific restriction enzyme A